MPETADAADDDSAGMPGIETCCEYAVDVTVVVAAAGPRGESGDVAGELEVEEEDEAGEVLVLELLAHE